LATGDVSLMLACWQDATSLPSLPDVLSANSPRVVAGNLNRLTNAKSTLKLAYAWSPCVDRQHHIFITQGDSGVSTDSISPAVM
jgi:hypothetical protein